MSRAAATKIKAALHKALPIDGSEKGIDAVAAALEAYAAMLKAEQPEAKATIRSYKAAAATVRDFWYDLEDDTDEAML